VVRHHAADMRRALDEPVSLNLRGTHHATIALIERRHAADRQRPSSRVRIVCPDGTVKWIMSRARRFRRRSTTGWWDQGGHHGANRRSCS
jgi:hypothetical protein